MNIYKDHNRMTNVELHDYHKRVQSRRNFWIAVPWVVGTGGFLMCCLAGWSTYPQVMMSASSGYHASTEVFGIITWALFAILTAFLPLESGERRFAPAILMGAYDLILLLFGRIDIAGLLMAVYYVGAAFALEPIRKELQFLRSHPRYPFLDRFEQDDIVEQKVAEFYQDSPTMQREIKRANKPAPRVYDSSMTDEVLSNLPKRHIEEVHIKHGYFDEPEQTYTDDLANAGEPVDRLSRKEIFEEPEQLYSDKIINPHRSVDVLAQPENYFDEIDEGFKGDITKAETDE